MPSYSHVQRLFCLSTMTWKKTETMRKKRKTEDRKKVMQKECRVDRSAPGNTDQTDISFSNAAWRNKYTSCAHHTPFQLHLTVHRWVLLPSFFFFFFYCSDHHILSFVFTGIHYCKTHMVQNTYASEIIWCILYLIRHHETSPIF